MHSPNRLQQAAVPDGLPFQSALLMLDVLAHYAKPVKQERQYHHLTLTERVDKRENRTVDLRRSIGREVPLP
jgi:hypothetical protein